MLSARCLQYADLFTQPKHMVCDHFDDLSHVPGKWATVVPEVVAHTWSLVSGLLSGPAKWGQTQVHPQWVYPCWPPCFGTAFRPAKWGPSNSHIVSHCRHCQPHLGALNHLETGSSLPFSTPFLSLSYKQGELPDAHPMVWDDHAPREAHEAPDDVILSPQRGQWTPRLSLFVKAPLSWFRLCRVRPYFRSCQFWVLR